MHTVSKLVRASKHFLGKEGKSKALDAKLGRQNPGTQMVQTFHSAGLLQKSDAQHIPKFWGFLHLAEYCFPSLATNQRLGMHGARKKRSRTV